MDRFYIGTAENIEAEYGVSPLNNDPFVVYQTYDDESISIEGFKTKEAAIAAVAEIEDRSSIEWMF